MILIFGQQLYRGRGPLVVKWFKRACFVYSYGDQHFMYLQHASEKAERASEGVGWGKGQRGFKNLSGMYSS